MSGCRPPCEGVGRNFRSLDYILGLDVALHVRAWVEISALSAITSIVQTVALHVRAWVEISRDGHRRILRRVALHVRAWVEMVVQDDDLSKEVSRPPCEGVGRNWSVLDTLAYPYSRPPCEGVGRNIGFALIDLLAAVALHVRAWVEMSLQDNCPHHQSGSRPPCEGVGRNSGETIRNFANTGRPPCEGVGRNQTCCSLTSPATSSPSM